jgi:hypothetical protein
MGLSRFENSIKLNHLKIFTCRFGSLDVLMRSPNQRVLENRRVIHGRPALHRLMVPPVRENILFHVFIQSLTHLIHVSLMLHRYFLNFCILFSSTSLNEGA